MNTTAKGSRAERRTMALLEAEGYACTRAAASLGAWDVIGVRALDVALVQVKAGRWPGFAEMAALQAFPCPPGTRRLVHRWRDRTSAPDVRELP